MLSFRALLPCSRSLSVLGCSSAKVVTTLRPHPHARLFITLARTAATPKATLVQEHQSQHRWYATKTDSSAGNRIYYGSLAPRMRAVKIFSLVTSVAGLAAQPVLMEQGLKLGGTPMAVLMCSFAGFFTFVTPFLLHFITKKYVTEIHYNPSTEEYTATTISIILQKIQTKFKPCDVKVPDVPGMFTSFLVKERPLFVDPALFDDPEHYVRIMGYDKPIDFKLDLTENAPTVKQMPKKS